MLNSITSALLDGPYEATNIFFVQSSDITCVSLNVWFIFNIENKQHVYTQQVAAVVCPEEKTFHVQVGAEKFLTQAEPTKTFLGSKNKYSR